MAKSIALNSAVYDIMRIAISAKKKDLTPASKIGTPHDLTLRL